MSDVGGGMNTPRRSVGGAAQGPITPSPGSSPGVSIPFTERTTKASLRRMLASRDRRIAKLMEFGWFHMTGEQEVMRKNLDNERRLIRERIKAMGRESKGAE